MSDSIEQEVDMTFDQGESVRLVETTEAAERRRSEWAEAREARSRGESHGLRAIEQRPRTGLLPHEFDPDQVYADARFAASNEAGQTVLHMTKSLRALAIAKPDLAPDYEHLLTELEKYQDHVEEINERGA